MTLAKDVLLADPDVDGAVARADIAPVAGFPELEVDDLQKADGPVAL